MDASARALDASIGQRPHPTVPRRQKKRQRVLQLHRHPGRHQSGLRSWRCRPRHLRRTACAAGDLLIGFRCLRAAAQGRTCGKRRKWSWRSAGRTTRTSRTAGRQFERGGVSQEAISSAVSTGGDTTFIIPYGLRGPVTVLQRVCLVYGPPQLPHPIPKLR